MELDFVDELANLTSQDGCVIVIGYNEDSGQYAVKIDSDSLYTERHGDTLENTLRNAILTVNRQLEAQSN